MVIYHLPVMAFEHITIYFFCISCIRALTKINIIVKFVDNYRDVTTKIL